MCSILVFYKTNLVEILITWRRKSLMKTDTKEIFIYLSGLLEKLAIFCTNKTILDSFAFLLFLLLKKVFCYSDRKNSIFNSWSSVDNTKLLFLRE